MFKSQPQREISERFSFTLHCLKLPPQPGCNAQLARPIWIAFLSWPSAEDSQHPISDRQILLTHQLRLWCFLVLNFSSFINPSHRKSSSSSPPKGGGLSDDFWQIDLFRDDFVMTFDYSHLIPQYYQQLTEVIKMMTLWWLWWKSHHLKSSLSHHASPRNDDLSCMDIQLFLMLFHAQFPAGFDAQLPILQPNTRCQMAIQLIHPASVWRSLSSHLPIHQSRAEVLSNLITIRLPAVRSCC